MGKKNKAEIISNKNTLFRALFLLFNLILDEVPNYVLCHHQLCEQVALTCSKQAIKNPRKTTKETCWSQSHLMSRLLFWKKKLLPIAGNLPRYKRKEVPECKQAISSRPREPTTFLFFSAHSKIDRFAARHEVKLLIESIDGARGSPLMSPALSFRSAYHRQPSQDALAATVEFNFRGQGLVLPEGVGWKRRTIQVLELVSLRKAHISISIWLVTAFSISTCIIQEVWGAVWNVNQTECNTYTNIYTDVIIMHVNTKSIFCLHDWSIICPYKSSTLYIMPMIHPHHVQISPSF